MPQLRDVAQSGRVLVWGASGRRFKSSHPDNERLTIVSRSLFIKMEYTVYIIRSLKNKRHYTGISTDVVRRLREHNEGSTKSTRPHTPYEMIWKSDLMTKSEALKLEIKIKKRGAAKFIKEGLP